MGSFESTQETSKELTLAVVKGKVGSNDILDWIANYHSGTVTKYILCDFTEADISEIDTEELRKIAEEAKKYSEARHNGKTALVVGDDLGFGFGRVFKSFAEIENIAIEYMIFRNRTEARKWLGV